MSTYVIDTQALVKLLNGQKVINDTIDNILQGADKRLAARSAPRRLQQHSRPQPFIYAHQQAL